MFLIKHMSDISSLQAQINELTNKLENTNECITFVSRKFYKFKMKIETKLQNQSNELQSQNNTLTQHINELQSQNNTLTQHLQSHNEPLVAEIVNI